MCAPDYDLNTGDGRNGRATDRQTDRQRRLTRKTRTIPRPTGSGVFEGDNGKEERERHSTRTHRQTDIQRKLTSQTKTGRGIAFGDNGKD